MINGTSWELLKIIINTSSVLVIYGLGMVFIVNQFTDYCFS